MMQGSGTTCDHCGLASEAYADQPTCRICWLHTCAHCAERGTWVAKGLTVATVLCRACAHLEYTRTKTMHEALDKVYAARRAREDALRDFDQFCERQQQRLDPRDHSVSAPDHEFTTGYGVTKQDLMTEGEIETRGNTTHSMGRNKHGRP